MGNHRVNKNCKCVIATDGCAEPFVLLNNKWYSLIDLKFKCFKCNKKINYSNQEIYKYPSIWDVKL